MAGAWELNRDPKSARSVNHDWKCLSLNSKSGYEYKGIVDVIAVKRDKKNPDKLHVLLLQVKGGSARVTVEEIRRLNKAVRDVAVEWNAAEKPEKKVRFLNRIT